MKNRNQKLWNRLNKADTRKQDQPPEKVWRWNPVLTAVVYLVLVPINEMSFRCSLVESGKSDKGSKTLIDNARFLNHIWAAAPNISLLKTADLLRPKLILYLNTDFFLKKILMTEFEQLFQWINFSIKTTMNLFQKRLLWFFSLTKEFQKLNCSWEAVF